MLIVYSSSPGFSREHNLVFCGNPGSSQSIGPCGFISHGYYVVLVVLVKSSISTSGVMESELHRVRLLHFGSKTESGGHLTGPKRY